MNQFPGVTMQIQAQLSASMDPNTHLRLQKIEAAAMAALFPFMEERIVSPDPILGITDCSMSFFNGRDCPLTRCFLFSSNTHAQDLLDEVENFFATRGSNTVLEMSAVTGGAIFKELRRRIYECTQEIHLLYKPLTEDSLSKEIPELTIKVLTTKDALYWAKASVAGWADQTPEAVQFITRYGQALVKSGKFTALAADIGDKPVGTACLFVYENIALLMNGSVVKEHRGKGVHSVLTQARLQLAKKQGCQYAAVAVIPQSQSAQIFTAHGFKLAHTRQTWHKLTGIDETNIKHITDES
ncbi:GNAT family N-acetyltransferase [Mucilaginibacter sp. PAMB04168]|uniref:GNAT family N-acetyltransferase n=1 Tax=Mucilaginibacter sp. PAMB04168 TaxID=3138567 RepID=UPI0031F72263